MVSQYQDRFARDDGEIGSDYTVPCGQATIFDGAVLPVTDGAGNSGLSPQLSGTTDQKTQVLYTAESMDSRDYVNRCVWSHDPSILGERSLSELATLTSTDPAFTLLVRMTKDPMLVDLGRDQDPACYDQGYGLRITCPRDGSAPVMKLVKFMPPAVPPGIARPSSLEPDGAVVLSSVTLQAAQLIVDQSWDGTGNAPYRGYLQETRLRVRRADERVILEVFHNDRNMHTPVIEYTDQQDPAWGDVGSPGFEFLSPALATQPGGVSPFELAALPIMRCHLFEVATVKDFHRPTSVAPANQYTYDRVIDRVITLVEKSGDSRYEATGAGTKRDTYLQFVLEAEAHIIRQVGYHEWLRRSAKVYLADGRAVYELPEDLGTLNFVRPSWNSVPLDEVQDWQFANRLGNNTRSGGRPKVYRQEEQSINNRPQIRLFPVPSIEAGTPISIDDDHLIVEYFASQIYPSEPDVQIPLVPQQHMDVLIYGGAAHALMLDTDQTNSQYFAQTFQSKLKQLERVVHRSVNKNSVMRSTADVMIPNGRSLGPQTRASQLENFLPF